MSAARAPHAGAVASGRSSRRRSRPAAGRDKLSAEERRRYLLLGVPALGLSLAATMLSAYLPVLAQSLTSSRTVIGALVGGEGFISLLLPIWVGAASDHVDTRLGRRLPFLLATAPVSAVALALLPFGRSIFVLAVEVFFFYTAYFTYYAPYRALYSDLVPREQSGRAQGIQGTFRGAGMGSALIGGALLLPLWRPLPYVAAAGALVATTLLLAIGLPAARARVHEAAPAVSAPAEVWGLIRDHGDIRRFLLANVFWQITESGLKTFIVLFLRQGLHKSFTFSAAAMVVVAAAALVAAPIAGKLADRYGAVRVMRLLMGVFGVGLWLPAFSRSTGVLLAELPIVGMGGAMALSLPYAILMMRMPRESHGAAAGLFDVSGGAGVLLGPMLTGAAIDVLRPLFESTQGYAAMWPVIGTASLLSIPVLGRPAQARPGADAGGRSPSTSST